ncbi:hypothetical protein [Chryseobacterium oryzae]|uniref:Lipoprotein n=1 Tax=Chryseobacterium oryzae TaxID=2929799 RepID=A0ABY4BD16_9FLAO|nr:hypothetical protein [Chryseobacterium oryzae]UOE37043.1 hypothetical protein MTP08_08155 [Chryseobacterium oryzae]
MISRVLMLLSILLLTCSCKKDCYTAPEKVVFELVNSSGQNLLENGTLTTVGISDSDGVGVQITKTNDFKIVLERVGSFNGTKNYKLYNTIKIAEFSIKSSPVTDDCDGFKIDEIKFDNVSYTKENGYYKVVLE